MEGAKTPAWRQWLTWGFIIILIVVVVYGQRSGVQAKQHDTCVAVNQLKDGIRSYVNNQLDRAEKSLPTIAYYRAHPVELGRQLSEINRQRQATAEAFSDDHC